MKAMVFTEYGPPEVLHMKEVDKPTPKDDQILVRNYATSVGYGDLVARNFGNISSREFHMPFPFWLGAKFAFGLRRPKAHILGAEFAGEVVQVGESVTRFKPGDQVFGYLSQAMGAEAEYVVIAEDGEVALKPENLTYEEAAVIPYGALTALNLLRKVELRPGDKVLINGASGGIGSAAVQLAKAQGAQVTGVCGTPRLEFVKLLGADDVIDYTQEDFTQNGETYAVIFDILGKSSFAQVKDSLKPQGVYLLASFKSGDVAQMLWTSVVGDKKVICAMSPEDSGDLPYIKTLVEEGTLTAEIEKTFPLEQAAAAHRYIEAGQKKGRIALTINHNGSMK